MKKVNKKIVFFIFLFSFLTFLSGYINAQEEKGSLEISYPQLVPEVPPPQTIRTYLPNYIRYLYTFAIVSGGIISFLALLYGGFLFLISTGNPGLMAEAREQIFAGILGLIVIFGSYIFLNEINPELTAIQLPRIQPARRGIIIYNDQSCGAGQGNGVPELVDLPSNIHYLAIESTAFSLSEPGTGGGGWRIGSFYSFHSGGEISVYFYENENCEGSPVNLGDLEIKANQCISLGKTIENIHCVRIIWRLPGVWLFSYEWGNPLEPRSANCGSSICAFEHYQMSTPSLPKGLDNNVRSIGLVATKDETGKIKEKYGVILHNNPGSLMMEKGWSEIYLPSSNPNHDVTVYNLGNTNHRRVSSVTIFRIPKTDPIEEAKFILCRNARCDPEQEKIKGKYVYVYPQLQIAWRDAFVQFKDISSSLCGGGDNVGARAINSSSQAAIQNPQSWSTPECGWVKIVGGFILYRHSGWDGYWRDEDGSMLPKKKKYQIPNTRNDARGVSAIYLPYQEDYIALLFYRRGFNPEDLANNSSIIWASCAGINASVPDLSSIRWNGKTLVLIAVRIKGIKD
jgi:hypothetical protein